MNHNIEKSVFQCLRLVKINQYQSELSSTILYVKISAINAYQEVIMKLEDFRIETAKLTRQDLSVLSGVSVSTIQRAEEGQPIRRLMIARILAGFSKHLGREVTRNEIDEFKPKP